jgi:lactaldehyde dehydrogenase/glycolaldehyde dehydrogenase
MLTNFINGCFETFDGTETIAVLDPSDERQIETAPETSSAGVAVAVAAAKCAQPSWAKMPAILRAGHLRRLATALRGRRNEMARIIAHEGGKLLSLAEIEVDFTADYIEYMAEWARRIEGEIIPSDRPDEMILLMRKPIGVVVGILPSNFPLFLIARKAAPALITGNTIVIKPSELTPISADLFAHICADSDLPPGVFNVVHGRGVSVGQSLASHPDVSMVSFTGSTQAGRAIMTAAADNITKVNLELGGKAPAIIMADADLDLAVRAVTASRLTNNGQVCNCAERIYVQTPIAEEFSHRLAETFGDKQAGAPLGTNTPDLGPLISRRAVERTQSMVDEAVAKGARVLTGGQTDGRPGFFYPATVLVDVRHEMKIMRDETFAPVAPIQTFENLDEAIARANDSDYGLTSSIYTSDLGTALKAVDELAFGETYINRENFEAIQGFHAGWRQSGIGGADGKHGVLEFTQTRLVYLQQ